ncbi:hypothetical protein KA005_51835 [bacterium]|nr:hypothetical protein [bacterium]
MLKESFTSPQEFLEYLKVELAKPIVPGVPDKEFERRTKADFEKHFPEKVQTDEDFVRYKFVVDTLKEEIISSLPMEMIERIVENIAMGALDTGEANAVIIKSLDNKYAILINFGLMTLLNKFFKLTSVLYEPKLITYCNRKPAEELAIDDLQKYIFELIENYKDYGTPYGAMIKLEPQATLRYGMILHYAEIFIMCHELGHFLNGDLQDNSYFSAFKGRDWLQKFEENVNYQMEYAADITGYGLVQRVVEREYGVDAKKPSLFAIASLFNLFFMLSGGASSTHPNPRERTLKIIEQFYGDELSELMLQTYDEPALLLKLFDKFMKTPDKGDKK